MDLRTAYETLDVQEDCSLETLNERYFDLTEKKLPVDQLENIQDAYNTIKNHIEETTPKPKLSFGEKVGEFFFHYKTHLIIGLVVIAIVGSLGYSLINGQIERRKEANRPPADLEVILFGDYMEEDLSPLEDNMRDLFPEWERIDLQLLYVPTDVNSEMDMGVAQKNQVTIATEKPDMYIFDRNHFNNFVEDGAFVQLDALESAVPEDKELLLKQEVDGQAHMYGLDVSDANLFSGMAIEKDEKIAVIRGNAQQEDNALELLEAVLKELTDD